MSKRKIRLSLDNIMFFMHPYHEVSGRFKNDKDKTDMYLNIISECNAEFFEKFELGELEPLLREAMGFDKEMFVADFLVDYESEDMKMYSKAKAREELVCYIDDMRFYQTAFYCRVTFSYDILKYFYAGDQFTEAHKNINVLKDAKKVYELVSDSYMKSGRLLGGLCEKIESIFGCRYDNDSFEIGVEESEISLFWYLDCDKGIEALKRIRSWIKCENYFSTLLYIGGSYYLFADIEHESPRFFTIYNESRYSNFPEND